MSMLEETKKPIPWTPPGRVEGRHVIVRDVLVEVPTAMDDASETQGLRRR